MSTTIENDASRGISRVNPPDLWDSTKNGHSQISIAEPGRLAFVSGQVAWRSSGEPAPDNVAEQMAIVVGNAKTALDAIGATPHDLVMVRLYVVDMTPARLAAGMPGFMAFLDGALPSVTGIGVAALAGPDLQVEMEMVVRLPS